MRVILSITLLLISTFCIGQNASADLSLLYAHESKQKSSQVEFKGLLKFYNKNVTEQILNDCIYEYSCSEFSQGALHEYGLFKGLMMTCDRLTRCNRATLAETSRFLLTRNGRIKEHWNDYKKAE